MSLKWSKAFGGGYQQLRFPWGEIILENRPHYCDRGNFIAKVFVDEPHKFESALWIDEADCWPRYYFDEGRAKLEIEAWLKKRKLVP